MALRDQPYLPLYVQDYLTDEKLNMCSASSQGIYIKILCLFHKSEPYGGILLKQKDKQNESTPLNFATKLTKLLPFELQEIHNSLQELLEEGVLFIEEDLMYQKRMVRDNEISELRSVSGKLGGLKTKHFALANQEANSEAKLKQNTEYENAPKDENKGVILKNAQEKFEVFRKLYEGRKNGFETEFKNFIKKNPPETVDLLLPALYAEMDYRDDAKRLNAFIPEWKNLQTWINKKCWLQELPKLNPNQNGTNKKSSSQDIDFEGITNSVYDLHGM